ncbi:MEMAR_RS02690 family S-layer glycoprotein [Methanoregula sp.]|uniref:MEMAR_RS02690 family S-layer glycoprotein n=1 Tax=Methanoregula sp. TaxID=2052170 RepID=UPI003561C74B
MTKRLTIALVALVALVLVAVLPASATFYSVNSSVNQGAAIFYGEQGLDITHALNSAEGRAIDGPIDPTYAFVSYWDSAAVITTTSPKMTVPLGSSYTNQYVLTSTFPYTGTWYLSDSTGKPYISTTTGQPVGVFTVTDPSLAVNVWDVDQKLNVNGGSVIQSENLTIRVDNNLYQAIANADQRAAKVIRVDGNGADHSYWMDLKVKTDSGNVLTALYTGHNVYSATNTVTLTKLAVNNPQWFLNSQASPLNWATDAYDANGQLAYPAGTYSVYAESYMNGMKDNYLNGGASYTGKTVSATQTITIVSNTVKITANKDSVVRSKQFSITVTGKPNQAYYVWVKGTSTMSGAYDDQPPMFVANQAGLTQDNPLGPYVIGSYAYQNGAGKTVIDDVADSINTGNGTYVYGLVSMSSTGTRTIGFATTNWTKAQTYTVRVENYFGGSTGYKSDEVQVKVEKGAVTIVAAGDQSYYLGEEIKFSGTNTESQTTYLFISGPNLGDYGAAMAPADSNPRAHKLGTTTPETTDQNMLVQAAVQGDNTWSYKYGTASIALDAGTYTVYATSQPATADSDLLAATAYGTVSIIVKKPFISATASQSTVAKGDAVFITGTAQGQPSEGVRIWILGKNYANIATQSVNSDASFSYEIKKEVTKPLYSGQYFIVAQHPMQNNRFDVYPADNFGVPASGTTATDVWTVDQSGLGANSEDFKLSGSNSLQGTDAAEALIEAINDANVDDTYTKLQILVEEPIITITPVGDRHVGDKFTITASTNLAVDDEVLFEVYSSSFQPTQKSQSGEFSGATGTVKVTKGDSGLNKLSFDVDASTFKPDEYLVKASAVLQEATGTSLFNVLEASAPTATPTKVAVTTTVPTTVATTIPPTTVATPTKTPTQPGFGALVALIGLGAVALLVVRRH